VPWTRVKGGRNSYFIKGERVDIDEQLENDGLIMHRDFGGTAKWRACYAGAGTGHSALYAVDSEVVRLGVTVRDRAEAVELIHEGGRCYGVVARCLRTGEHSAILANATVIATGGHGRIYGQYTTNATINEGMGSAIALNTGVVPLGNMEAVQFHPTALSPSGILVTEGCRGDGGYLLDKELHRFMVEAEPEKQELASRDVVSRHMARRMRDGHGVETEHGPHLWLDVRQLGEEHLKTKLREVWEICRDFAGLDPAKDLIPVRPTQHYSMGGVRVNKEGEAYSMAGLFAVGEASCWDMHGFNRLGGNSLAETIVSGRLVGRHIAKTIDTGGVNVDTRVANEAVKKAEERVASLLAAEGTGPGAYKIRDAMAEVMIGKVGIFRTGEELALAVDELKELLVKCDKIVLRSKVPGMNPELTFALRIKNMVRLSLITAMGALARTESRGAHYRSDYPLRDDTKWLNRTLVRWPESSSVPEISYEPVGVLDVPPGHRGYGRDERIEMEQTIEDYNRGVEQAQSEQGKLPTEGRQ
jgi:fumarate reductase flavoprotein subunit